MSSWGISASRNKSHDDDGIMNQVELINMRFSSSPSQWCNWRLKKCNFLLTVETRSMSRHNRLRSRFSWGHDNSQRKHVSLFPFCLLYDKFSLRAPQRSAIVFVVVVGHFSCSHSTMKKSPKRHKKSWDKISAWDTKKGRKNLNENLHERKYFCVRRKNSNTCSGLRWKCCTESRRTSLRRLLHPLHRLKTQPDNRKMIGSRMPKVIAIASPSHRMSNVGREAKQKVKKSL